LYGSPGEDPAHAVVARETIELVFIAALTRLPPRQRAAFIARDVLELSAAETAVLLDVSETSANSLVQRARTTMRAHIRAVDVSTRTAEIADVEDQIVRQYVEAHERGDHEAIVAILRADVRVTMPPEPACIGSVAATAFFAHILGPAGPGDWRLVPTRANNQPAVANYLRHPGEQTWRALSIDVLDIVDGQLRTINCFLGPDPFALFGLEPELPPGD
jgi:RNA polymerase sigma-70 factor (ECF subfamily)